MEEIQLSRADSISDIQIVTVQNLVSLDQEKRLNLQPDFQRRKVWPKAAKSYLIDTILRGLPIPEIFAFETPKGILGVIDGQQRLSTILDFINAGLHVWNGSQVISYEDLDSDQRRALS